MTLTAAPDTDASTNLPTWNSAEYFTTPLVSELGFREYDARWIIEPVRDGDAVQINYRGFTQLGNWLGRFLQLPENGGHTSIVVGHDFRRYSEHTKNALTIGLMAAGLDVHDAGLNLSPSVYATQFFLSIPACAMVTASHNPNGWTGVKMGHGYAKTFGAEMMAAFKKFSMESGFEVVAADGRRGGYVQVPDSRERYLADLREQWGPRLEGLPRMKVAVETGNGTGGIFLPSLLRDLGFDVAEGHVEPDWDFPNFNPNPESVPFLKAVRGLVERSGAELGLCLDGDGDRIGVVDDRGRMIFNDRVGLLMARHIERRDGPGSFVVDVKSTSLFDTVLESRIHWEKTGHSYIKAAVAQREAVAGFERSGHFFLSGAYGRGYDDACVSSLLLLWIACEAKQQGRRLSDLLDELPASHQSPNRQPVVPEARKYEIVDEIHRRLKERLDRDGSFAGTAVDDILTINGIRVAFADGSWLLVRASSNTPNLVIIAESFDEDGGRLRVIDEALRELVAGIDGLGAFDKLHEM